jgi:hypothetical protein
VRIGLIIFVGLMAAYFMYLNMAIKQINKGLDNIKYSYQQAIDSAANQK